LPKTDYPFNSASLYLTWAIYIAQRNDLLGEVFTYSEAYVAISILAELDDLRFPVMPKRTYKKTFFRLVNEGEIIVVDATSKPRKYKLSDMVIDRIIRMKSTYNLYEPSFSIEEIKKARKSLFRKWKRKQEKKKKKK